MLCCHELDELVLSPTTPELFHVWPSVAGTTTVLSLFFLLSPRVPPRARDGRRQILQRNASLRSVDLRA